MSLIKNIGYCMFSPRLYKIYRTASRELPSDYNANHLESWGDLAIYTMYVAYYYGFYFSPLLAYYCYNKGSMLYDHLLVTAGLLGPVFVISLIVRSLGRAINPNYMAFVRAFRRSSDNKRQYIKRLRRYDFDFDAWPVTYSAGPKLGPGAKIELFHKNPFKSTANDELPFYKRIPIQILGYIATHTFAMPLIFPGSLAFLQNIFRQRLTEGRAQLVENHNGQRAKVSTRDNNEIDTMFIDQRDDTEEGHILVICTEGNSGFYEVGIMMTPVKAGYSTLGWNHPGFGGSTGMAYPRQEKMAIDAVIQYAITELQFDIRDIVLYGWSIGGYSSAWAAARYPKIKCLVLDATFDEVLPLAMAAMPQSWAPLVREVILTYANLNVSTEVFKFNGPVDLIRRTDDEVICIEKGNLITNRGNYLILKIIAQRHPELSEPQHLKNILQNMLLTPDQIRQRLFTMTSSVDRDCLKIVRRYLTDFKGTHCEPLADDVLDNIIKKYD